MSKWKAFTLVELLVVIAIIALLIAILAPSLKAAKDLAKATYCKTTLNALNKSVLVYAEMNRGYMMVYTHDYLPAPFEDSIEAPRQPNLSAVAFTSGMGKNPTTGLYADAINYGLVYVANILGPAEMFYCPGNFEDPRFVLANYPKPWGSGTVAGSRVHTSYMWNPWVEILGGSGSQVQATYEDELLLERHPNERFLTTDMLTNASVMSHQTGNSATWNHGYADGHVEGHEYPTIYARLTAGLEADAQWQPYQTKVRTELEKQF